MGQVDEAMAIFERGVDMYTFCFGPNHPMFCVHFCTLADLYFKEGAYAQAKVMLLLAFETCARILGDDHIITAAYRTKLAAIYMKEETFKRSEEILSINANICSSLLSNKVKFLNETVEIYYGLASSLAKNGSQDEALKLLIKVKEMCKSRGDKINHDLYLSSIFLLSDIYNSSVRSTESQKELEDAWRMLQQNKDLKITSFALVKITCQMLSCYVSTLDLQVRLMLETVEKEVDSDLIPFMNIKLWDEACLRVVSSLWTHKPNEFVETIIKKYHSFDVMNDESKKELLTSESLPNDTGISLALQIAVISKLIKNYSSRASGNS
jgi:tetratricopeptide (TPR) repeat protein